MISKKLLDEAREFAFGQAKQYGAPAPFHVELAHGKGNQLANQLGANADITTLGTLLMDCMLGVAVKENRIKDHVGMSEKKTKELLTRHTIDDATCVNVLACVREHHGDKKFSSIESEICCNADCYRFISVKGFLGAARFVRDMNFEDWLKLMEEKVEEKWSALTLDVCKRELEPQYQAIKAILHEYHAHEC